MSPLSVQISVDDEVFELTKTLTASISFFSSEAPPNVTISPNSTQITFEDDDGMYILTICPQTLS